MSKLKVAIIGDDPRTNFIELLVKHHFPKTQRTLVPCSKNIQEFVKNFDVAIIHSEANGKPEYYSFFSNSKMIFYCPGYMKGADEYFKELKKKGVEVARDLGKIVQIMKN